MPQLSLEHLLLLHKLYDQALDPVAQSCGLNRMELDLLLFLHNNPTHNTAAEAVQMRRWTKSHVSAAVHTLEAKGLLAASHPPGNRKLRRLTLLPAADGIICQGVAAQNRFQDILNRGVTPEERRLMKLVLQKIIRNLQDSQIK